MEYQLKEGKAATILPKVSPRPFFLQPTGDGQFLRGGIRTFLRHAPSFPGAAAIFWRILFRRSSSVARVKGLTM